MLGLGLRVQGLGPTLGLLGLRAFRFKEFKVLGPESLEGFETLSPTHKH